MGKYEIPSNTDDDEDLMKQLYEWHLKMFEYHKEFTDQHLESAKNFQKLVRERAAAALMGKNRNAI